MSPAIMRHWFSRSLANGVPMFSCVHAFMQSCWHERRVNDAVFTGIQGLLGVR